MDDFEIRIVGQNFTGKEPRVRVLISGGIDDKTAAIVMRECADRQKKYAREREREREQNSAGRGNPGK